MEQIFGLDEIDAVAKTVLAHLGERKVVAFYGEMGAGKTTFITSLCRALGATGNISSPTFSIINEYHSPTVGTIYHLDLYRLKDEAEALDAGVEECFFSGCFCFVEWPEKAADLLPDDVVRCRISAIGASERILHIKL